ncbi:MAG: hypothetical protein ACTHOC_06235 [Luteimonas sp.]
MTRLRSLATIASTAVALIALAACATVTGSQGGRPGPSDGDTFTMVPGDTVSLPGEGALRYARVANDSRCLPDVQCIWAGDAEVAFEWRPDGGAMDAFSLHTGQGDKSHRIGRHLLTLVALARGDAPEAQLRLDAAP